MMDKGYRDLTCPNCGTTYMGKVGSSCPSNCGTTAQPIQKSEDELTKKVIDDNDLIKGF